ncbi:MAG: hypothetical protein WC595_01005 [Candidatus Nanoarchaeia archaeon]
MNTFKFSLLYLKLVTLLIFVFSFIGFFTVSFDPFGYLEQQLILNLYGTPTFPAEAIPAFTFAFSLFCLASILLAVFQYAIIHYGLEKKQKWAYYTMCLGTLIWIGGATLISLILGTPSYIRYSVLTMIILLVPPLVLLKKYF